MLYTFNLVDDNPNLEGSSQLMERGGNLKLPRTNLLTYAIRHISILHITQYIPGNCITWFLPSGSHIFRLGSFLGYLVGTCEACEVAVTAEVTL